MAIFRIEWRRLRKLKIFLIGVMRYVKLIKIDDQGRLDFSRKALIDKPEGYVEKPKDQEGIRQKPLKSVDSNNFEIPNTTFYNL